MMNESIVRNESGIRLVRLRIVSDDQTFPTSPMAKHPCVPKMHFMLNKA